MPYITNISRNTFICTVGIESYEVTYWHEGCGILRYSYQRITRNTENVVVNAAVGVGLAALFSMNCSLTTSTAGGAVGGATGAFGGVTGGSFGGVAGGSFGGAFGGLFGNRLANYFV